jgi:hypothetical protein
MANVIAQAITPKPALASLKGKVFSNKALTLTKKA